MGRILIADDHDSLRRGLAQALAEASHDVEEAPNGNAAIEKLHEGFFDVVVSDLKMGGSTGLDVLKTAKTLHPTTAVILMTAFGSVSTAVEAMKSGAFDYVQKPFEIEEMEVEDREGARDAPDAAPDRLPPPRPGRHLRLRPHHRVERRARQGARRRAQGGQEQHHGARPRRDRHRQGADRRRDPPQLAARRAQLHQGELRGAAGEPARVRALRPREGRVHRAPTSSASAASSRPTAARCSSTRSAT